MRVVVGNSFSLNMLQGDAIVSCKKITREEFRERVRESKELVSIIGHQGTAELVSVLTGVRVEANRVNFALQGDDVLLVAVLRSRLDEGVVLTKSEAERVGVDFWEVRLQ